MGTPNRQGSTNTSIRNDAGRSKPCKLKIAVSFCKDPCPLPYTIHLKVPGRGLWAIEIKRSPSSHPEKRLSIACQDLKPARQFVANAGFEPYPIDANTMAIDVLALAPQLDHGSSPILHVGLAATRSQLVAFQKAA